MIAPPKLRMNAYNCNVIFYSSIKISNPVKNASDFKIIENSLLKYLSIPLPVPVLAEPS